MSTYESLQNKATQLESFIDDEIRDLHHLKSIFYKLNKLRHNGINNESKLFFYKKLIKEKNKDISSLYNKLNTVYMYMDAEYDLINGY